MIDAYIKKIASITKRGDAREESYYPKVKLAQEDLKKSGPTKGSIVPILYRPFDIRFTYYTGRSKRFHCMPRGEVMRHMLSANLGLILPRRVETAIPWGHAFVAEGIVEHVAVSLKTIDNCFLLYRYEKSGSGGSGLARRFSPHQGAFVFESASSYSIRRPNINSKLFTKDHELFNRLAKKGEELIELHLLKFKKLVKPIARCEGSGDLRVVKVTFDQNKARVHINPEKWFARVPSEVWEYHIGGYQVSEKWLKDRKGGELSSEEVAHYARVVTAIAETIKIQRSLDDLFKEVETSLLEISI